MGGIVGWPGDGCQEGPTGGSVVVLAGAGHGQILCATAAGLMSPHTWWRGLRFGGTRSIHCAFMQRQPVLGKSIIHPGNTQVPSNCWTGMRTWHFTAADAAFLPGSTMQVLPPLPGVPGGPHRHLRPHRLRHRAAGAWRGLQRPITTHQRLLCKLLSHGPLSHVHCTCACSTCKSVTSFRPHCAARTST